MGFNVRRVRLALAPSQLVHSFGGVQIDIGLVDRTAGGLRHGPAVLAV